jgi:autotransporter-associated beta strand protein
LLFGLLEPIQATTRIWTGAVNGYWSEPGNWSPSGAPAGGDQLQFVPGVYGGATLTNDLVGLTLDSVYILSNSGLRKTFRFRGNGFSFVSLFQIEEGNDVSIDCPLSLAGNAKLEYNDSFSATSSNGLFVNGTVTLGGFGLEVQVADHGNVELDSIAGPGSLSKSGGGTAQLSNGFGPQFNQISELVMQAGTLEVDNCQNSSTLITVAGSGSTLAFLGPATFAGEIDLSNHFLTIASITKGTVFGMVELSGPISGSGGLTLTGYQFAYSGGQNNEFTGSTVVQCQLLELNKSSGARAFSGPLSIGSSFGPDISEVRWMAPYQAVGLDVSIGSYGLVNLNDHNEDFGPVNFYGGEVDTGTGQFAIYAPVIVNPSATTAVINGYLGLPPGADRLIIVSNANPEVELQINAVIFGAPNSYFVKQGPGTMKLTGVNTFDTVTLLEEGTIDISNDSGLGTWPGLIIFDGATLRVSDVVNTGGGIELLGTGVGGTHGAIEVLPTGNIYIGGSILLDAATTFNVEGALGLGGVVSGTGPLLKAGNGIMSLSGSSANAYSGDTVVNAGEFYLSKSAAVPGNLVVGPGPAGPVTFARLSQSGGVGGGTVTVNANGLFDLFGNNQTLGVINLLDGGNVSTGAGTLTLANGGAINVGSQDPLGTHASSTINGFITLASSLINPGSATVNVSPHAMPIKNGTPPELTISAAISGGIVRRGGGGTFTKNGLGALELSGNNNFIHYLQVNEGTLVAGSVGALGSTSGGTGVSSGAALALDGGVTVSGEGLSLSGSPIPGLLSWSGNNTWDGPIYMAADAVVSVDTSLQITGEISGPAALAKVGGGSLIFGGSTANTYAGNTLVNAGNLILQRPAGITQIPQHVVIGTGPAGPPATLLQQSSFSIIGQVTVNAGGLWDLSGQAEGFSMTSPPPLTLNGGGSVRTGSGIIYLPVGGDVVVNPGAGSSSISGNIGLDGGTHHFTVADSTGGAGLVVSANIGQTGGDADIQKDGPGKMIVAGANSFTGTSTIADGVFEVDGSQPSSPFQVTGGTLTGTGGIGSVDLNGVGALLTPGGKPGIMNCGNVNAAGASSGTMVFKLAAAAPPLSSNDQLNVQGTVNLNGIKLACSLSGPSSANDQFTIINNDGSEDINGTFSGQAEGSKFYVNGALFSITYKGGDGNDVVLKRLITPSPPLLSIQPVTAALVRLLWPTNDPPFRLQLGTDLTSFSWTDAMPAILEGANNVLTNGLNGPLQFYRLISP